MTTLSLLDWSPQPDGWKKKAPNKAAALRDLLADGQYHGQAELQAVGGQRFGARLFDLHNTETQAPLHYEKRFFGDDDSHVQYRSTDRAHCDICTVQARKRPAQIIDELRAEVAALREENARLRGEA